MEDVMITRLGTYRMRNGARVSIVRQAGSRNFLGVLDDGETIRAWNEIGECLSGEREYDIIGPEPLIFDRD